MSRNKNIELLRALAISYMLLYHYSLSITGIVQSYFDSLFVESLGQFALIAFFVLSGFGLYLSFERLEVSGKSIKFIPLIKRRLRALLPQYYFCIGFTLFFTTGIGWLNREHIIHVIESLLLLQNFDIKNGINGVTWTIAVIFQLYIFSIPLYRLVKKYSWRILVVAVVFTVLLKKSFATYITMKELDEIYYVVTSIRIPLTTIDLVLSGMCAAHLCYRMPSKLVDLLKKPQTIVVCIVLIVLYHYSFIKGTQEIGNLFGNSWFSCIWQSVMGIYISIICMLLYYLPFTYSTKIGKGVQFIAKYEYGIYLWHMILMGNFMQFQPDWYILLQTKLPIVLLIIICCLAVFIGYMSTKLTSGERYSEVFNIKD